MWHLKLTKVILDRYKLTEFRSETLGGRFRHSTISLGSLILKTSEATPLVVLYRMHHTFTETNQLSQAHTAGNMSESTSDKGVVFFSTLLN